MRITVLAGAFLALIAGAASAQSSYQYGSPTYSAPTYGAPAAAPSPYGSSYGAPAAQPAYGGYGTGSNPASHYVQGYERSNGTYVAPHYQTNPNGTTSDNYGTRGNYNPYTGRTGTKPPKPCC